MTLIHLTPYFHLAGKYKMIEEVTRNCIRIVRHIRIKDARISEVWLYLVLKFKHRVVKRERGMFLFFGG